MRKVAGGVTTLFSYGPGAHLVEEKKPGTSPATVRNFVYVEDEPVGVVDQAAGGSPSFAWVHGDRLTTPRAVTQSLSSGAAKVIWRASYAPFGLATPNEDPDGNSQSFALNLRFPGQVFVPESGGHYNYFRDYDPTTSRYVESDPIGLEGGINTYAYVAGNPITLIDPFAGFALQRVISEAFRGRGEN